MGVGDLLRTPYQRLAAFTLAFAIFALGWFTHRMLGRYVERPVDEATRECRDEVLSVDNARGAVSCSQAAMTSELKDGYLVCKCKRR